MTAIKHRKITVENITCTGCEEKIISTLEMIKGIHSIDVDSKTGQVSVSYDLMKTDLGEIEQKIEGIGYKVHESFWGRLKDRYVHFTEDNERDNLNAPNLPCCSHPDSILDKKKYAHRV